MSYPSVAKCAVVSAVLSGETGLPRREIEALRTRTVQHQETMESATPIRGELRENDDDASDDVALLIAAIFGVVRLLD